MTVSERARNIYKLIKPSGKTWADAMRQAHEEIFTEEARLEEADAERELGHLEDKTNNDPGPLGVNNLLNDIIIALEEKKITEGEKTEGRAYPYSRAKNALEKYGLGEFTDLIYEYTKADSWDSDWRDPNTGRIKNEWLNAVDKFIVNLGLDTGKLDSYNSVAGYFR